MVLVNLFVTLSLLGSILREIEETLNYMCILTDVKKYALHQARTRNFHIGFFGNSRDSWSIVKTQNSSVQDFPGKIKDSISIEPKAVDKSHTFSTNSKNSTFPNFL